MSKQLRIWLFVLLSTILTSTTLLAEGVITMTTSERIGAYIYLKIEANGNFTIEGAQRDREMTWYGYTFYTIMNQKVTIRGDVTTLACHEDSRLTSLSVSGCTALTELDCSYNQLSSLNLSSCTALTKLKCDDNPLTSINLSGCQSLKEFSWTGGKLTSLDVSQNTALTKLNCRGNELTSLNVSSCTALTYLNCEKNQLTSLNVSGCTALRDLYCKENQLTSLNVSGCTALTELNCRNNKLTSLDVSSCTALTELNCRINKLTNLDISGCTALTELDCGNNKLTSLDVLGCTALTTLDCTYNPLTSINLSNCTSLKKFTWEKGQLTSLKVSGCTSLTELLCYKNQLTSLDVSGCTALTWLSCYDNQLTSLDVSSCTALTTLWCYENQLTSLNLSGCTALTWLHCYDNQLTSLDVSGCTALTELYCYGNQINGEGMTKLVNSLPDRKGMSSGTLRVVDYSSKKKDKNQGSFADVATASKKNWEVQKYEPYYSSWTSYSGVGEGVITMTTSKAVGEKVDLGIVANGDVVIEGVSEMPQLGKNRNNYTLTSQTIIIQGDVTKLDCYGNQLMSLDVSGCSALTKLDCSKNQLTSFGVSGCSALTELDCSSNQLTNLNVSKNTALTMLVCYDNQINGENMTRLVTSLPSRKGLRSGNLVIVSRRESEVNLCRPSDIAIAQEKNWIPKWQNGDSYKGFGDGVIIMTTSKAVGEKVDLGIVANGDVVIEGVSEMPYLSERYSKNYTLTSQTITIRGDITELACVGNQLTSLDVSGCTTLTKLDCNNNQLTSLDVSGCTTLTKLDCYGNQLTSLNVSGCTALTKLVCYKNRLKGEAMTQMAAGLSDRSGKESGSLYVVCDESDENNLLRSDVLTASRKNWQVFKYIVNTGKSVLYSGAGGDDEIVMTITKEQYLEGGIRLAILADGDVTIEGVHEKRIFTDGSEHTYTLAGTQITIRGNVTELDCSKNQITNLDLSKCNSLWTLSCSGNKLTNVDVSRCSLLTYLDCSDNQINGENMTRLVTNLPSRKGLRSGNLVMISRRESEGNLCRPSDVAIAREKSWISKWENGDLCKGIGEGIITMTTSKAVGETILLEVKANGDFFINGAQDTGETNYLGGKYYRIKSQTIIIQGDVTELDCPRNRLTNLNVSGCITLTELNCYNNQLNSLNVSQNTALTGLGCSKNQLNSLNVSGCTALTTLSCEVNQLTSLNVSGCTALTELECNSNQLTSLDISGCTALTELNCYNNQLTSLNVSGCTALTELECGGNQLSSLDVSKNTALTTLSCYSNQINGENMTRLVNSLFDRKGMSSGTLRVVDYSSKKKNKNWCSIADVATASKKNWAVQKYGPYYHSWTSYSGVGEEVITMTTSKAVGEKVDLRIVTNGDVVIEGVSEMTQLGRNSNNYTLTSQTITIRGDVAELDCFGNQLTSLNVSGCTALTKLDCSHNQLTSLDLSQNSALVKLVCSRNKLETLDLSACPNLESLACYRNKIRGNAVAQLVESLPDRYGKELGKFYFVYYSEDEYEENFCYRPAVGRANDKNWRPQKHYSFSWEDYFGVMDEGVVMMRTAQEVGSQITLTLEAKGDVAIDGVKGVPETDGKPHQYTLISQDVTIRGYVTKLHCSGNKLTSLDLSTTVPLVELDCSNNQLTTLDVSHNVAVTSLTCYRNQIKGEAMAQLIKGLPQLPLRSTHLFGIVSNAADEGNVFLKADVERVQDKGWSPMKWDEKRRQYEPYAGKETETFAVTLTSNEHGEITIVEPVNLDAVPYGTTLTVKATGKNAQCVLTELTANGTDILATQSFVVEGATEVKATFVDHTGVETTVTQQVKLYPNPATDYVIVEGVAAASEVTLHSMTGERLYAGRADGRGTLQIDLTPYADGVYLVCVAGETYRVVVRH